HTEPQWRHLNLLLASISSKANPLCILAKTPHPYLIAHLQWPLEFLQLRLRILTRVARLRNRRNLLFKAAYLLARLTQPLARHIPATDIHSHLCQRSLHLFQFAASLRPCLIQNLHTLLFKLLPLLLKLLALILRLG